MSLGPYTTVEPLTLIYRPKLFSTGERTRIASFVKILGFGAIRLGDQVFIGNSNLIDCTTRFTVGSRSQLGPRGLYYTHGNTPLLFSNNFPTSYAPLTIGDDCEVAMGSIVCPGVTIGDRSYVFPGSVVTTDLNRGTAYYPDRKSYRRGSVNAFRLSVGREKQLEIMERYFLEFAASHKWFRLERPENAPWRLQLRDGRQLVLLRDSDQVSPAPVKGTVVWRLEPGSPPQAGELVFQTLTAYGRNDRWVEQVVAFLCNHTGVHMVIRDPSIGTDLRAEFGDR
jgi:acetyltransferase-like isoleucine patch superfamily enzyme